MLYASLDLTLRLPD